MSTIIKINGSSYTATVEITENSNSKYHTNLVFTISGSNGNYFTRKSEQKVLVEKLQESLKTRSLYEAEFSDDYLCLYFSTRGENTGIQYILYRIQ